MGGIWKIHGRDQQRGSSHVTSNTRSPCQRIKPTWNTHHHSDHTDRLLLHRRLVFRTRERRRLVITSSSALHRQEQGRIPTAPASKVTNLQTSWTPSGQAGDRDLPSERSSTSGQQGHQPNPDHFKTGAQRGPAGCADRHTTAAWQTVVRGTRKGSNSGRSAGRVRASRILHRRVGVINFTNLGAGTYAVKETQV